MYLIFCLCVYIFIYALYIAIILIFAFIYEIYSLNIYKNKKIVNSS